MKTRKIEIIKTAEKRITRHGIHKTTLEEIARDLRIGKATIYHYFNSKEELYRSTIEWVIEEYLNSIKIIFENENNNQEIKFHEYLTHKLMMQEKFPLLYILLDGNTSDSIFEWEKLLIKKMLTEEVELIKLFDNSRLGKNGEAKKNKKIEMLVHLSNGLIISNSISKKIESESIIELQALSINTLCKIFMDED